MATADVPFKSAKEIESTISYLESKFSDRYSEQDPWYARTVKNGQRWLNVPVVQPWPPKRGRRGNYDSRNRRGGRHGYYDSNHYDNRGHRGRWDHDQYRSHDDYYRDDHRRRSRSPFSHRTPPSHHSPPPPRTPTPHHSPQRPCTPPPHHSPPPHHHTREGYGHNDQLSPPPNPFPLKTGSTVLEAPPTPTGEVPDSPEPVVTETKVEKKIFDIESLGVLGANEPKAPPTQSDVMDILNTAHGGHTASSLLKQAHHTHSKHKHSGKQLKKSKSLHRDKPSDTNLLQITHGESKNVHTSQLFESLNNHASDSSQSDRRRKRPTITDSDGDSEADIDVITSPVEDGVSFTVSLARGLSSGGKVMEHRSGSNVAGTSGGVSIAPALTGKMGSVGKSAPSSRKSALSVLSESLELGSGSAADTTDVSTNTTDVSTNATDVSTNTTDIATNTTGESTTTTYISASSLAVNVDKSKHEFEIEKQGVPISTQALSDGGLVVKIQRSASLSSDNNNVSGNLSTIDQKHYANSEVSFRELQAFGREGFHGDGDYVTAPSNQNAESLTAKKKRKKKKKKKVKDEEMTSMLSADESGLKLKFKVQ